MLRIGIVDDHSIVRAGFREMIGSHGNGALEVVFEAASGEAALDTLSDVACDVLLLDISLPGKSGVDVLRQIRQDHKTVRVLILSGHPEDRYASALIRQGAHGYLGKDCDAKQLLKAIRTVANGRRYLSEKTARVLAGETSGDGGHEPHERLSDREMQVFLGLARGDSATKIAQDLELSVKTISTYRTRLLEKLGVSSNAEVGAYAVRKGFIGD